MAAAIQRTKRPEDRLHSHVVYGLRITTNLPVPGFAICNELKPSDVLLRLNENSVPRAAPGDLLYNSPNNGSDGKSVLQVGVFPDTGYFGFFYSDQVRFAVSPSGDHIHADWPESYAIEDAAPYLIGPVMGFVLRLRGVTCLHASAVAIGDQAIALVGSPGAGKSTTAAAFALRGDSVLSDDVVALTDQGNHFVVQPGYPRINLWPDSARSLFGSAQTLPRISPTWEKCYMPLDQANHKFESRALPLRAIYVLAERDPNLRAPVIESIAQPAALLELIGNAYVSYLLDSEMRRRDFNVLGRIVASVPVRHVRPTSNPSGLSDLCDMIASDAKRLKVSTLGED
jgi:hypothetical protein